EHTAPFETAAAIVETGTGASRPREIAILCGRDGKLLSFDPGTGALLWEVPVDGEMRSPPAAADGVLVVATSANKVLAVEPETGAFLWSRGRPAPTGLTVMGHSRAMVNDGIVYAAFSDGYAEAYVLEDGRGMWSRPLSLRGGDFVDSDADPVIADGRLFVASYSDGIYALDPRDGSTLWNRNVPAITSLGVHGKTVLAGSADGWLWGIAPEAGELEYRTRLPVGTVSRMIVLGDAAMMTAGDGIFLVLDARNGKPLQATMLGGTLAGEPVIAGDELALIAGMGDVVVMRRHR
ncbi:MAG: PQQ-binding-like beta-propeller repeat protein, partial [Clostridia bacterium]|nr:PQQ-binding-like beta-propeller repeat protein [Deltaproteobacteria bacterium]